MSAISPLRIGGWLLLPLAWLLMSLLSMTISIAYYGTALLSPAAHQALRALSGQQILLWYISVACAAALFIYTLWLSVAFFKRRSLVRKHYIIWLLFTVLLAVKAFAFSPVSDTLALRQLLFPLLAAAILAPYFKRSTRVQQTFVNP
ncbi:membrane protein [Salmonella enterica subsp. enterica serovar Choleraesuis]|nr:membrane protein [Salmonella enterica subsp. enterica serovar Choleraesuis]